MTTRFLILSLAFLIAPVGAKVVDEGTCQLLHHHALDGISGFDFEASRIDSGRLEGQEERQEEGEGEGQELAVRSITFVRLPIFDLSQPEDDRWLYRLANRFHHPTRERALHGALVFREGDTVTPQMLEESERVLRGKLYVHDARVLARRRCGHEIDVDVVTRDVWTLSPRTTLSRKGGENRFGIGLGDTNFMGTGKAIVLSYDNSVDRESFSVSYADPNVLGSRLRMGTNFTSSDDGDRQHVDLRRPFYSLDARYSWGVTLDLNDRVTDLYFRGNSVAGFRQESRRWEVSGGLSGGRKNGRTTRMLFGVTREEENFALEPGEIAPMALPRNREVVYPWIGFEMVEDAFERTSSFDRIGATEDLFLGRHVSARFGWAGDALGGDSDRLVFNGRYGDAFWVGESGFFKYGASVHGYWNDDEGRLENTYASVGANFRLAQTQHLAMFSSAEFTYTRGLTEDRQLLLGGDTGLRGYPLRFQAGDRSWLLSVEERYFTDWHLFSILRVGAAAFFDVGRAWFPSESSQGEYGVLADVGVGLRFESTRTQSGRVHHLDFAFPLQSGDGVDGFQVVLTLRETL